MENYIYLDNNATTIMPPRVMKKIVNWMNHGNPSANYSVAMECQKLIKDFKDYIAEKCLFKNVDDIKPQNNADNDNKSEEIDDKSYLDQYKIIFTSCSTESNNMIIRSVTSSFAHNTGRTPHLIISAIEHKSILKCAQLLKGRKLIELTELPVDQFGFVQLTDLPTLIRPNTCLISIMSANNETGAINNIKKAGEIAHKHNVPFHTDCTQSFGKHLINPIANDVDAFSVSFHKLYGPQGVGILVVKKAFLDGYKLCAEICGTQNDEYRGGTENIPAIAGAFEGMRYNLENRLDKNNKLRELKKYLMITLSNKFPCQSYKEYLKNPTMAKARIVFISGNDNNYLSNTILLSFVKGPSKSKKTVCNGEIKRLLEKQNIIISIGSACNTKDKKASHVLYAMNADDNIRRGALRISLGDQNTKKEIDEFVNSFLEIVGS